MTNAQSAAYVTGQAALLLVELEAMKAANVTRERADYALAYGEEQFLALFNRYDAVLGWNAVQQLFERAEP